jgi:NosR/NirI family nitrous oxide reductase transcriptional regulator
LYKTNENTGQHSVQLTASPLIRQLYLYLALLCLLPVTGGAYAAGLIISPPKAPEPFIKEAFPDATQIEDKSGEPSAWTAYQGDEIIGYAFETDDVARIPAYSGEPVNVLVAIDAGGKILTAKVLEHHEPILLVGIPETRLQDFTDQYVGFSADDRVKIGGKAGDGIEHIDGVSGATVTVMVMNLAIMRAATKVAQAKGIIEKSVMASRPVANIKHAEFSVASWDELIADGSISRFSLTEGDVDQAFEGTDAERTSPLSSEEAASSFIDLYYTQLDIPTIGQNLLGESEYQWLMETLQPGEYALGLMGNGFSFKGSGYVRGGIFDRIQIHQGDNEFSFRDVDQYRINDLYAAGTPGFKEMSIFIVREHHNFDPGTPWQFELLVRRQTGPIDSVFTSFKADFATPEKYLSRPVVAMDEDLPLWQQVWNENTVSLNIVMISMVLLLAVIFLQDWLVRYPVFLHTFRRIFLVYTIFFIGWYSMGQLSVVNVFTFVQALMGDFQWQTFLLDPVIFVLWVFVAMTVLLWGRGIYCGWLCPFGALQELLNELAIKFKVPQIPIPFALHERLWAMKYMILLALFGLSLESLATAEQYAEVEPFKTTFLLRFDRDWPFVSYAAFLIILSIFNRKIYCRYICPLGAAIAIPSGVRLFDWLKRRKECGKPCQLCANECEIGAIVPTGEINLRECHQCLDCQVTYQDKNKCPPLVKKYKKRNNPPPEEEMVRFV